MPIAVPVVRRPWNHFGKIVAEATVSKDDITREDRDGQMACVSISPSVTMHEAVAMEYAIDDVVIGFCCSLGITISSLRDGSNSLEAMFVSMRSLLSSSSLFITSDPPGVAR